MMLHGKFTVRLADIVCACFSVHTKNFIIILIFHESIVTLRKFLVKHPKGTLT